MDTENANEILKAKLIEFLKTDVNIIKEKTIIFKLNSNESNDRLSPGNRFVDLAEININVERTCW